MELVLNNLISNALKFTPEGGKVTVVIESKRRMEAGENPESSSGWSRSSVVDTGIGIPAAAQEKVFERFYQVDGSHTRAGEGTGIGLALSKELAELMGGSIAVESEPGKGSVFIFWLPVEAGEPRRSCLAPSGEALRNRQAPTFAAMKYASPPLPRPNARSFC